MPNPPRISVLVPTLNRHDDLQEFLATLVSQSHRPHEFVLVDAGDDPRIEAMVQAALAGSGIELVYMTSAPGTSLQRNLGLDRLTGEIVFLFDDDVLLEPDYIEKTLPLFDLPHDPPVGGVLATFSSPGRTGGLKLLWFRLFGMTHAVEGDRAGMSLSGGVRWLSSPSKTVPIPVCSGGRTAYRAACFEGVRFDEFLPGYTLNEDVEISHRIAQRWTLVQSPDVRLFHKRSPTSRVDHGDRVSRLLFARWHFFRKHLPKTPWHVLAFAWSVLGISLLYTIVGRGAARGVLHGYGRILRDICGREVG